MDSFLKGLCDGLRMAGYALPFVFGLVLGHVAYKAITASHECPGTKADDDSDDEYPDPEQIVPTWVYHDPVSHVIITNDDL